MTSSRLPLNVHAIPHLVGLDAVVMPVPFERGAKDPSGTPETSEKRALFNITWKLYLNNIHLCFGSRFTNVHLLATGGPYSDG